MKDSEYQSENACIHFHENVPFLSQYKLMSQLLSHVFFIFLYKVLETCLGFNNRLKTGNSFLYWHFIPIVLFSSMSV